MSLQTNNHNETMSKQTPPSSNTDLPWTNHPAYLRWLKDFFRALFDFEFHESVTVKMLPLVYGIGIFVSAVFAFYATVNAFLVSFWRGLGFLFVLGPLAFLFCTTALRSILEFFSVVFRIQHRIQQLLLTIGGLHTQLTHIHEEMEHLANAVDNVATQTGAIARTVNEARALLSEVEGITGKLPFFKRAKKVNRQKQWAEAPLTEPFDRDLFSTAEAQHGITETQPIQSEENPDSPFIPTAAYGADDQAVRNQTTYTAEHKMNHTPDHNTSHNTSKANQNNDSPQEIDSPKTRNRDKENGVPS